jgi:hypothetical protein
MCQVPETALRWFVLKERQVSQSRNYWVHKKMRTEILQAETRIDHGDTSWPNPPFKTRGQCDLDCW